MSAQPVWETPPGTLGTIPEGVFYSIPLVAYDPDDVDTVYFKVIAGQLPNGIQINEDGILAGTPQSLLFASPTLQTTTIQGVPYPVPADTTSQFAVRAYTEKTVNGITVVNRLADRTFSITVTGQNTPEFITPAGQIATYFDGSQVTDLQIETFDPDIYAKAVVTLAAGSLPPGLSIAPDGVISGLIYPNTGTNAIPGYSRDFQGFDEYGFDFDTQSTNVTYEFTLRVSNGVANNLRTFSILVYSRNSMTADNAYLTADNTFVTADVSPQRIPVITTPTGSIGTVRNDNFFAFQIQAVDFDGDQIKFVANTTPPGLTLDPNSGWLYGYIPNLGLIESSYPFNVRVYKAEYEDVISNPYSYSLTVIGPISSDITWLVDSDLGTINNGAVSTFYVAAVNSYGLSLQYQLLSGSNSKLPQGLQLLPSGEIAGHVSFDTFALDEGKTTFDVTVNPHYNVYTDPRTGIHQPTTFDLVNTFTVNAYSNNGVVNVSKTFTITVNRVYNEPYDNLYIQAMPPQNDRNFISTFLQDTTVFNPALIYRYNDPNFGVATNIKYYNAYGLTDATLDAYVDSLNLNHYWKNLTLGSIETAQALDSNGNILYEIVYSRIIDNLVNNHGESVSKQVDLAFPVMANGEEVQVVYPNSLQDMRTQVIDTVGQVSNILPQWMVSKQSNGQTLGFTPAWVICYTLPNQSGQIAYNIKQAYGERLNLIDYQADRYELDRLLSHNWDAGEEHWVPQPPEYTRFDQGGTGMFDRWVNNSHSPVQWVNDDAEIVGWQSNYNGQPTTFDGNSLQFIAPVDMYTNTQVYDKYLLFPKRNIINTGPLRTIVTDPSYVSWINNSANTVVWVNSYSSIVEWTNE